MVLPSITRQQYLLVVLSEECAEVIQRISKALRFGLTEVQPGQSMNNLDRIQREVFDLIALLEMTDLSTHFPHEHPEGINECPICDKKTKVEDYLQFSRKVGVKIIG